MNYTMKENLLVSYFHVFGCTYFVSNNRKDHLGKQDAKYDEAIFLGYSSISKAYRIFNKRTLVVEESIHVIFNEAKNSSNRKEGDWMMLQVKVQIK